MKALATDNKLHLMRHERVEILLRSQNMSRRLACEVYKSYIFLNNFGLRFSRQDQLVKWYSARISNPSIDEGVGSNPGAVQKKRTGRHLGAMTWPPLECQKFRAETLVTRGVSSLKTPCYLAL